MRHARYTDSAVPFWFRLAVLRPSSVVRHALLLVRAPARAVTFSWFLVAIAADLLIAQGTLCTFLAGTLLVQLKVWLDIVDGEIGRHQKQFLSSTDNAVSHLKGLYLDRIQHAIESPIWGFALGYGMSQLIGSRWFVLVGVCLAAYYSYSRHDKRLRIFIRHMFSEQVALSRPILNMHSSARHEAKLPSAFRAAWHKALLWLRNGKRFNILLLVAATIDMTCQQRLSAPVALPVLVLSAGVMAFLGLLSAFVTSQIGTSLIAELQHESSEELQRDRPLSSDRPGTRSSTSLESTTTNVP